MWDDCGQSLVNHNEGITYAKQEPICRLCCQTFSKKSNLKRHNDRFHSGKETKSNVQEKLICEECGQSFSVKSNLTRHKTRFHCENKKIHQFKCDLCQGIFQWKKMWIEHMFTCHNVVIHKQTYVRESCEKCGQTFHNKRNLLRHEKSIHETTIFECDSCDKVFRRKDSLATHKFRAHCVNPEELKTYECYHCSKKFFEKHLAKRHILNVHMNPKQRSSNVKCMKCDFTCPSRTIARMHYESVHGIKLKFEKLQFETVEEFESWRTEMQRSLVTQFVQQSTGKTSTGIFRRFVCHRSGTYKDLSRHQPRKRQLKNSGSKKIQGFCPAEIVLKIQADKCSVQFQSVHVGHTIASEEELRHIYLDKAYKRSIASKLLEGVPKPELLKMYHVPEKLDRLHKLKPRDIWNISQNLRISNGESIRFEKFVTPVESVSPNERVPPAESFVVRKDSVLYSKNQGESDVHFGLLKVNDFIMILMDQSQAKNLQRYGCKVVAFDSTDRVNSLDFILHALMVVDVNCEVAPVAFLLTNRNDRLIIDIFIRCIRDRVGVIKSRTLMSDMRNVYLDSWTSLMEPPEFYQFSAWHVNECWRRKLAEISDERKRSFVCQQLLDIEQEMDVVLFEQKLNAFISIHDSSLLEFLNFFKKIFYDTRKQWAYCYRILAGVPVTIRMENFHNVLELSILKDKNIETAFENTKFSDEFPLIVGSEKRIGQAELSNKREILKKNHHLGVQFSETNVASVAHIDDRTWQIVSFEGTTDVVTELYTIEKLENKECILYDDVTCQLYCEDCEICFHEYRCSCLESALHLDMCKHFHVLGLYLQTHRLLEIKELGSFDCCENANVVVQVNPDSLVGTASVVEEKFCADDLEKVKSQIIEEVQEVLKFAKEMPDLELIRSRFIQPMKLKLMDG